MEQNNCKIYLKICQLKFLTEHKFSKFLIYQLFSAQTVKIYFSFLHFEPAMFNQKHLIFTNLIKSANAMFWHCQFSLSSQCESGRLKCQYIQLECCGYSGPIDWAYSSYNGYQDITKEIGIGSQSSALPFTIPQSCCRWAQIGRNVFMF